MMVTCPFNKYCVILSFSSLLRSFPSNVNYHSTELRNPLEKQRGQEMDNMNILSERNAMFDY